MAELQETSGAQSLLAARLCPMSVGQAVQRRFAYQIKPAALNTISSEPSTGHVEDTKVSDTPDKSSTGNPQQARWSTAKMMNPVEEILFC